MQPRLAAQPQTVAGPLQTENGRLPVRLVRDIFATQMFPVVISQAITGCDPQPLPVVRRKIHDHGTVKIAIDRAQVHRRHRPTSIDADQRAGRGPGPDIAIERSDAVDLAVLQQRMVRSAIVAKVASPGIHDAQRLAAADPYPVQRIDMQRLDRIAGQRRRVVRIVSPGPESRAVVTHQPSRVPSHR